MDRRTERIVRATQSGERDADVAADALTMLKERTTNAEAALAATRYLDLVDNDDGRHDRTILDALAPLLERESAFQSTAGYLDATRTLAEVALRHQRWTIASNALLVLESRLAEEELPAWVRSYRAKLFFRLEHETAFVDPDTTFELLGPLAGLDTQGTAVAREFLALARDRFRDPERSAERAHFIDRTTPIIQPILTVVGDLWQQVLNGQDEDDDESAEDLLGSPSTDASTVTRRPAAPPPRRSLESRSSQPATEPATALDAPSELSETEARIATPGAPAVDPELEPIRSPQIDPDEVASITAELEALRARNAALEADLDDANASVHALTPSTDPFEAVDGDTFTLGRRHVLVLGAIRPSQTDFQGIAKQYGISKEQLAFETDYDKLTMFDLESLRHSTKCAGIVIGPVPHKMRNVGSATSAIELLRNGDGFPPSVPMYAGTELKGTKTSFRRALEELRDQMRASGAPTVGSGRDGVALRA